MGLAHTRQFFVSMLLQAATILPDLVKPAPDWPAPPAKKKKKKKNNIKITVFSFFTPCPHHYHVTTIYNVVFICKTHLRIFFVGYFTMLSVIQTIKYHMEVWFMKNELERIWKKRSRLKTVDDADEIWTRQFPNSNTI